TRRLDENLLSQAQTLARLVQFQTAWSRLRYRELHLLGLLSSNLSTNGYLLAPVWIGQSIRSPLSAEMFRRNFETVRRSLSEIQLNDNYLLLPDGEQVAPFFQINSTWGKSYRSASLGPRSFPFDPDTLAPDLDLHWAFDDTHVGDIPVR